MTDDSIRSAGYALMIEDYPDQKVQSKRKTYAPLAFGSRIFSPAQLKMSMYSEKYIFWQSKRPSLSLHTSYGKQQSQQLP